MARSARWRVSSLVALSMVSLTLAIRKTEIDDTAGDVKARFAAETKRKTQNYAAADEVKVHRAAVTKHKTETDETADEVKVRVAAEAKRKTGIDEAADEGKVRLANMCEGIYVGDGKTCRTQKIVTNPDDCGQVWALWSPGGGERGTWDRGPKIGGKRMKRVKDVNAIFVQCVPAYLDKVSPCAEHSGMGEKGIAPWVGPQQCSAPGYNGKFACDGEDERDTNIPSLVSTKYTAEEFTSYKELPAGLEQNKRKEYKYSVKDAEVGLCHSECFPLGDCEGLEDEVPNNLFVNTNLFGVADTFAGLVKWTGVVSFTMSDLLLRNDMHAIVESGRYPSVDDWVSNYDEKWEQKTSR